MRGLEGSMFTKDQMIFMVNAVITGAWDRIEAALPGYATNKDEIDDWNENEAQRREMIHGQESVVAAALPIIYANLTNDGMGIGEFPQFDLFERQVEDFIRRKTDPKINRPGNNLSHPDAYDLARSFVEDFLADVAAPSDEEREMDARGDNLDRGL